MKHRLPQNHFLKGKTEMDAKEIRRRIRELHGEPTLPPPVVKAAKEAPKDWRADKTANPAGRKAG